MSSKTGAIPPVGKAGHSAGYSGGAYDETGSTPTRRRSLTGFEKSDDCDERTGPPDDTPKN
jgi:hypothetical protein